MTDRMLAPRHACNDCLIAVRLGLAPRPALHSAVVPAFPRRVAWS